MPSKVTVLPTSLRQHSQPLLISAPLSGRTRSATATGESSTVFSVAVDTAADSGRIADTGIACREKCPMNDPSRAASSLAAPLAWGAPFVVARLGGGAFAAGIFACSVGPFLGGPFVGAFVGTTTLRRIAL